MKKKVIFLVLTVLVISVLLLAGCGVSQEEFQGLQAKVEDDSKAFDSRLTGVENAITQGFAGIQEDIKELKTDLKFEALKKDYEAQLKAKDAQMAAGKLETRVAESEKDINELRQDVKDIPRSYQPAQPPRPHFRHERVSFLVTEAGNYKFTLIPTDATILIDDKTEIGNGDAVYLKAGKHWYFSYDSIKVTIIRKY